MHWESPWWLLTLLAIPVLLRARRAPVRRGAAVLWVRTGAWGARVRGALVRSVTVLPWVALLIALAALARPQRGLRLSEIESKGVDIVLAIDISGSMSAEDFLPLNRLHVAKETAREFIRARPHDRIGLVGFSATAFTQCPLTLDHDALLELLDGLDFTLTQDGTAIGMALATAAGRFRGSKTASKVVVLLTDGANNSGAIDPLSGAELCRALGVKVYTVLVGRGGVVPVETRADDGTVRTEMQEFEVDPPTLQAIAARTGGRFFRATEAAALSGIYAEIDRLERSPVKSVEYREYRDLGPAWLGVAALLLAFGSLSGATWAFRLP